MLRKIYLHGELARDYGAGPWELNADTPTSCVRGLCARMPELKQRLRQGYYHFVRDDITPENSFSQEAVEHRFGLGNAESVHILPEVAGSGSKGSSLKLVAGIVLLGIATAGAAGVLGGAAAASGGLSFGASAGLGLGLGITWGNIAMIGVGLALQGVSGMLAPAPELGDAMGAENPQERPSFLFNGPVNVQEQGGSVPLVFGRCRTGSTVISAGIRIEQLETEE